MVEAEDGEWWCEDAETILRLFALSRRTTSKIGGLILDSRFLVNETIPTSSMLNTVMVYAAKEGDSYACKLAKALGATDVDNMLSSAALGQHKETCELARRLGATEFGWMLWAAASAGSVEICRLAIEWGATDLDGMVRVASNAGVCLLAAEIGGSRFVRRTRERMLTTATKPWKAELALKWGATDLLGLYAFSVKTRNEEMARFCLKLKYKAI
jgi:hypothetical protein